MHNSHFIYNIIIVMAYLLHCDSLVEYYLLVLKILHCMQDMHRYRFIVPLNAYTYILRPVDSIVQEPASHHVMLSLDIIF